MTTITDATRRHRIRPAQTCTMHIDRIDNLGRQMAALETMHRELIMARDKDDFVNKVYTFGRLTKDTCVGFLELAGALVGGPASRVSSLGTAAIDTAQSASEVAHGQANRAEVTRRSLNTLNGMVGGGAGADFMQMKVQQGLNIDRMVADARAADTSDARRRAIANGLFRTLADTVESAAKMAGNPLVERAAQLTKAVQTYQTALNETFEQRLEVEYDIATAKQLYLHNNRQVMRRLRTNLNEAMDLLNQCQGREVRPQR
ncbi:hypothetical protein [Paracoccus sp. Ld10]|uniref:hypothetical protein n=1 Tax=Paracoccus sp. Ld10 TaxID=649158 RepID=UPI003864B91A